MIKDSFFVHIPLRGNDSRPYTLSESVYLRLVSKTFSQTISFTLIRDFSKVQVIALCRVCLFLLFSFCYLYYILPAHGYKYSINLLMCAMLSVGVTEFTIQFDDCLVQIEYTYISAKSLFLLTFWIVVQWIFFFLRRGTSDWTLCTFTDNQVCLGKCLDESYTASIAAGLRTANGLFIKKNISMTGVRL